MKVIAVVVQSVNGLITKGADERVYQWTSDEDKRHLRETTAQATLIVMGSTTYDAFKKYLKLSPKTLRIVLTSKPEKYIQETVVGQLEFYKASPQEIVEKYSRFHRVLHLLGGSKVYSDFFRAGLINELVLTVEPKLFGGGKPLIQAEENADLELVSLRKLNDRGTLLLTYKIL